MLNLLLFKPLWGHQGNIQDAIDQASAAEFQGIEGQAPLDKPGQDDFKTRIDQGGLEYIAEITTAGSYVPDRQASLATHLETFKTKLDASLKLHPILVTSLAGCDAWPENKSIDFFAQAMEHAEGINVPLSFETHRSRSFFNPWVTKRITEQLPNLKLTMDISHWCVVCERLMDSEHQVLNELAPSVQHIHARVGYDQGPQVPDPRISRYQSALKSHQGWWLVFWQAMQKRGMKTFTMTPEFGPDGYQALDTKTDRPIGDLWEFNQWIGKIQKQEFSKFANSANNSKAI